MSDARVQGTISGGGTTANISAEVACVNSVPTGNVSGNISFFTGSGTNRVTFSSDDPLIVATIRTDSLRSVGAKFENVTVRNTTTNQTFTNCQLTLDATRLSSDRWIGSFSIFCPSGPDFFIFGTFTGNVSVDRQVFCRPLL